jgi:hypothetical protein
MLARRFRKSVIGSGLGNPASGGRGLLERGQSAFVLGQNSLVRAFAQKILLAHSKAVEVEVEVGNPSFWGRGEALSDFKRAKGGGPP